MINSTNNPLFANKFEKQIQRLMQLESRKKRKLQQKQKSINVKKQALSDIDDKLSSLSSLLTSFEKSAAEKFRPLTGKSSNPSAIDVISTNGLKDPANYSITVNQLAKEDIVLSQNTIFENDNGFAASSGKNEGSFKITVGSGSGKKININTAGLNNREVLEAVATEINDTLDKKVAATVYEMKDGKLKLSLKSVETGEAARIKITNKKGDLSKLQLGHVYTKDELNAKFKIDGISFERSSNTIGNVIEGFTFELNQTTEAAAELKVTRDIEAARKSIEEFIDRFNAVNSTIRSRTFLNGKTGNEGPLQDKRMIRRLSYQLKQTVFMPVESMADNKAEINRLANIGIEISDDGSLTIADSGKLNKALEQNPEAVMKLFSADDGIVSKIKNEISRFVSDELDTNVFESIQNGFDRKIDRLDDRIADQKEYLVRKEANLRQQFLELAQVISKGKRQFQAVQSFRAKLMGM